MTPSVASVTRSASDSNHGSRKSATLCVRIFRWPTTWRSGSFSIFQASRAASQRSRGRLRIKSGGGVRSSGSTKGARRSGETSYPGERGGGRGGEMGGEEGRQGMEEILVLGVAGGVALRELGDLLAGLFLVGPHDEVAAVGEGRKEGRVFGQDAVAEALELEFADDALLQQAAQVGGGRDLVARPDFFGDAGAAHERPALDHQQIGRAHV